GLNAGLASMGSGSATVAPPLIGSVEAAWTPQAAGGAVPAAFPSARVGLAASRNGMGGAPDTHLFTETDTNLPSYAWGLRAGLAGAIAILGQAYRDGAPISVLLDSVASEIGSTPAVIPPQLIPLGVSAAFTAQEAGVALPATVAGLEGTASVSQFD